jgi:AcrR family transcriptional regulator
MSSSVNPRRAYDSPRRREQAAATRQQILAAAKRSFERDGYAATTMAAIAAEAGVAVKTVYLGFDTKSGVLRALWNQVLRGDENDIPIAQRPWYLEVLEEPDPERRLRRTAENGCRVKLRIGGVAEVIRTAAPQDADIGALWERIQTEFHDNQRGLLASLHADSRLRPGLSLDEAADILWTLNHPDVWQLLVTRRGWTPQAYERWLADTLCAQLLR